MAGKREKPEEIVMKLRQVEVLQGKGMTIAEAVRQIGVTQQTYYRWRKLYGGMSRDQLEAAEGAGEGEPAAAACGVGSDAGQADPDRGCKGKLLSPSRRRKCIDHVRQNLAYLSAAPAARLGSTDRRSARFREGARRRASDRRTSSSWRRQYGRYGYRMVTRALLNNAGWHVNHKRVERIWRREGLKVPQKQKKKGPALAERRLLRPAQAGAAEPCLVL
jgi:putative transposase